MRIPLSRKIRPLLSWDLKLDISFPLTDLFLCFHFLTVQTIQKLLFQLFQVICNLARHGWQSIVNICSVATKMPGLCGCMGAQFGAQFGYVGQLTVWCSVWVHSYASFVCLCDVWYLFNLSTLINIKVSFMYVLFVCFIFASIVSSGLKVEANSGGNGSKCQN